MAIDSTSTVIAQTTTAQFLLWVNEIFTELVTKCGLTQMNPLMDTGQMAVPSTTAVPVAANTSAGYYNFLFTDALSKGPISLVALVALTPGTGYNGGTAHTFTGVALSGGSGSGAIGTVVLGASGVVSSITPTTSGTGYLVGDQLFITSANIVAAGGTAGGGSSGFAFVGRLTSVAAPVVIKLEFGSGSAAANPQMWITIGTGWTSNGTLNATSNGALTTRCACLGGAAVSSTITPFTSRYNYNNTLGYLGLVFKIGATGVAANALGAIIICRTSDNGGNPTADAAVLITNSISSTGTVSAASAACMQCMSYTANAILPSPSVAASAIAWLAMGNPFASNGSFFNLTATLENSTAFVSPIYTMDPAIRFSAYNGVALATDFPVGNTSLFAMVGATALNFISVGVPFGGSSLGGYSTANLTFSMLWQ